MNTYRATSASAAMLEAFNRKETEFCLLLPAYGAEDSEPLLIANGFPGSQGRVVYRNQSLRPVELVNQLIAEGYQLGTHAPEVRRPAVWFSGSYIDYTGGEDHLGVATDGTEIHFFTTHEGPFCVLPHFDGPYADGGVVAVDIFDDAFPTRPQDMALDVYTDNPELQHVLEGMTPDNLGNLFNVAWVELEYDFVGRPSKANPRLWIRVRPTETPPCDKCGWRRYSVGESDIYPSRCRPCMDAEDEADEEPGDEPAPAPPQQAPVRNLEIHGDGAF